jgi:phosphoribosylamine--glycine ligase
MMTSDGPKVLEFNVRFGDPEAQPILFRLKTDLVEIIQGILDSRLDQVQVEWKDGATICVVMASGGYPGPYEKGKVISGLDRIPNSDDLFVFHAGTRKVDDKIVTSGGRVLGVTAHGADLSSALAKAYDAVKLIDFKGRHFRTDIGQKGLNR